MENCGIDLHATTKLNDAKTNGGIDHKDSLMDGDPLVLIRLSTILSCMKNRNVYYLSSNATYQKSNSVHGKRDQQPGIQENICPSAMETPKKRRKQLKSTIKLCKVCGDIESKFVHYGGRSCESCRAFFRRTVETTARYTMSDVLNIDSFSCNFFMNKYCLGLSR